MVADGVQGEICGLLKDRFNGNLIARRGIQRRFAPR